MRSGDLNMYIGDMNKLVNRDIKIMEVCGTHTQVIAKAGFAEVLDPRLKLVSGPGCPVCVTSEGYIDAAIALLQQPELIVVTFGDLLRVKGTSKSLEDCMEQKHRIRVVYSPFAALKIAKQNRGSQVVFLAVGFETTAPLIAAAACYARDQGLDNLSFLTGLKLMPPVLEQVLSQQDSKIDALLCPGHVAVIMGAEYFRFVAECFNIPAAIAGFEPKEAAEALHYLVYLSSKERVGFDNLYTSYVSPEGNKTAKKLLQEVFEKRKGYWRGIGVIAESELRFCEDYQEFDAEKRFGVQTKEISSEAGCQCSRVIMGSITPFECRLFGSNCTIEEPKGPCMVSSEGACAIYYKYKRRV